MEVTVNQQNFIVPENINVQALLVDILQRPAQGLAIAVNEIIVPKNLWESCQLNPGDKIIMIKATQGG